MNDRAKTIADFIAKYPDKTQRILEELRKAIHDTVPGLGEKISYGIPTFTLNGRNLVHFSAYQHHIGFYPGSGPLQDYADELGAYETSKGTVRFPMEKPLPYDLIKMLTLAAVSHHK